MSYSFQVDIGHLANRCAPVAIPAVVSNTYAAMLSKHPSTGPMTRSRTASMVRPAKSSGGRDATLQPLSNKAHRQATTTQVSTHQSLIITRPFNKKPVSHTTFKQHKQASLLELVMLPGFFKLYHLNESSTA
jgi:hypothetical protein